MTQDTLTGDIEVVREGAVIEGPGHGWGSPLIVAMFAQRRVVEGLSLGAVRG